MKKTIFILSIVTMCAIGNRTAAQDSADQNKDNQSNGVFEMIAVYVPDFVAFKQVADRKIEQVDVFLVSGYTIVKPLLRRALYITFDSNNGNKTSYIAGSEFRLSNFDIKDSFFKAEKIKIVADGVEMFYDIDKSVWLE